MKRFVIALSGTLALALALQNSVASKENVPEVMSLHLNPRAEGIIGSDGRRPFQWGETISLTRSYKTSGSMGDGSPFDTRKLVRLLNSNRDFVCTGSVVGPTTILTAAHCVYWNDAWLPRGDGRPMFAETWDGEHFEIENWLKSPNYNGRPLLTNPQATTEKQYSMDLALVYTSEKISEVTGGFLGITRYGSGGKSALHTHTNSYIIGFHGDVDLKRPKQLVFQECLGRWRYIKYSWLGLVRTYKHLNKIHHECDSSRGSSGSPMLTYVNGQHIFGVHVASNDTRALAAHIGANNNRRIYAWLFKRVREDRIEYGYRVWRRGSGPTEEERYLTSYFQGPEDVEWLH